MNSASYDDARHDNLAEPETVGLDSARLSAIPNFFSSYTDSGKLAGLSTLVARRGKIVHHACIGQRSSEHTLPVMPDTIFRIYSMTKPVTSLAMMMLYEEGHFQLNHEVSRYIPAFKSLRVWAGGTADSYETQPCEREMTIRDLLTHTSGLTYDFMFAHPLDALYRKAGITGTNLSRLTLKEMVEAIAEMPLLFSPGTQWSYSMATDICGYLVELLSGQSLDEFFAARIFIPLGMSDTGFSVPKEKLSRFAACYDKNPQNGERRLFDPDDESSTYAGSVKFLGGGGGLVSTATDYWRLCQFFLNKGTFNGVRLVSRKTIELMTLNHLPGGAMRRDLDQSVFSETGADGTGFGLGFSILIDPAEAQMTGSVGNLSWGGAASTFFWIDPQEELIAILLTQLIPSTAYPLRPQFQQLVYAAIAD